MKKDEDLETHKMPSSNINFFSIVKKIIFLGLSLSVVYHVGVKNSDGAGFNSIIIILGVTLAYSLVVNKGIPSGIEKIVFIIVQILGTLAVFYLTSRYFFHNLTFSGIIRSFPVKWLGLLLVLIIAAVFASIFYANAYISEHPEILGDHKVGNRIALAGLILLFSACFLALYWATNLYP